MVQCIPLVVKNKATASGRPHPTPTPYLHPSRQRWQYKN